MPDIRRRSQTRRRRPRIELLERREVLASLTVTSVADSGPGTLRQAILDANASASPSTVAFNIPGAGVHTIALTDELPVVFVPISIDGYTQPGARPNTLATGDDAAIMIELTGTTGWALTLDGGDSVVRGLAIGSFPSGGILLGSSRNVVAGDFVGTDATGTVARGNGSVIDGPGVDVSGSAENTIGGTAAADRNLISGNGNPNDSQYFGGGVRLRGPGATRNEVAGNLIGTDVTGTKPLGFQSYGVAVPSSGGKNTIGSGNVISGNHREQIQINESQNDVIQGNVIGLGTDGSVTDDKLFSGGITLIHTDGTLIGGTAPGAGNIVSGNAQGIDLGGSTLVQIQGNFIGTDATGGINRGNRNVGIGVGTPSSVTIGGTSVGARNVISGNGSDGIELSSLNAGTLIQGNLIGTDATGEVAMGNRGSGIEISGSQEVTIGGTTAAARNIISGNGLIGPAYFAGIKIERGKGHYVIQGNYIGTDESGSKALGNGSGIMISEDQGGSTIGGDAIGSGNLISGNLNDGILVRTSSHNLLRGNTIGLASDGIVLGNNQNGIHIADSADNTIGGAASGIPSVIAGNDGDGILLENANRSVITGTIIGADASGNPRPNRGQGVDLQGGSSSNTIGAGNVIAFNLKSGIALIDPPTNQYVPAGTMFSNVIHGNRVLDNGGHGVLIQNGVDTIVGGLDPTDGNTIAGNVRHGVEIDSGIHNAILGNAIASDTGLGILLNGPAAPDPEPSHPSGNAIGPNDLPNAPELAAAYVGAPQGLGTTREAVSVFGRMAGRPGTAYLIQLFANASPGGPRQGQRYLGSVGVMTDDSGVAPIAARLVVDGSTAPANITATATDSIRDTSEFSASVATAPGEPHLSFTAKAPGATSAVGDALTFTYNLTNTGPAIAPLGILQVRAGDGFVVDAAALPGQAPSVQGSVVTAAYPALKPGDSVTLVVTGHATRPGTVQLSGLIGDPGRSSVGGPNPLVVSAQAVDLTPQPTGPRLVAASRADQSRIVLRFDGPLDPARAAVLANYRLVLPAHGRGRDIVVPIAKVAYDPAAHVVTLTAAHRLDPRKVYRLTISGHAPRGLADPAGHLLAGGDAVVSLPVPTPAGPVPGRKHPGPHHRVK